MPTVGFSVGAGRSTPSPTLLQHIRQEAEEAGALYLDLVRRRNAQRLTEEFRRGSCHAGRYETSLVLAERPELVNEERMRSLEAKMIDMPAAIRSGQTSFLAMGMEQAYAGEPARATPAEGEETFDVLAEMLCDLIREVAL